MSYVEDPKLSYALRELNYELCEIDPEYKGDGNFGPAGGRSIEYRHEYRGDCFYADKVYNSKVEVDDDSGDFCDVYDCDYDTDKELGRTASTEIPHVWSDDNAIDFLNLRYRNIEIPEKVFTGYLEYTGKLSKKHEHACFLETPLGLEDYVSDLCTELKKIKDDAIDLKYSAAHSLYGAMERVNRKNMVKGDDIANKAEKIRRRLGSNGESSTLGKVTYKDKEKAAYRAEIAKECMLAKRRRKQGK